MALRIRRGTDAQRSGKVFETGEIVWTTDSQQLWVGDGLTQGGIPVIGPQIAGFGLTYDTGTKRLGVLGLTTDDVAEGSGINKQYFTQERAQDAAALLFTSGTHVGVAFQYDDALGKMNVTVDSSAFVDTGLLDVVNDTTPQLGGNLDLNSKTITGNGNVQITGNIEATGVIKAIGNLNVTDGYLTSNNVPPGGISYSAAPVNLGANGNPNTLWIRSDKHFAVNTGITSGTYTSGIVSRMSRGTLAAPTAVTPNDPVLYAEAQGYDGTNYIQMGAFGISVDPTGTVATGSIPSVFGAIVPDASGSGVTGFTFNNKGTLSAPVMMPGSFTTTQRNALTPAVGMIIYNTTDNKFQGYQNTGGTTLEWVDLS